MGLIDYSGRLRKEDWEVRPISLEVASRLVRHFHYARGSSNTATYRHGLFLKGEFWEENCKGVALWIPPTKSAALSTFPENWQGVLSLSRLVVVPDVPKNACTFLLARSVKMIDRALWPCLVTYADSWRGHTGGIYKAAGWNYAGRTGAEAVYTISGRMVSRKAGPRTRTKLEMAELGATEEGKHWKHKFVLM
jgi:hypothetical protein